MPRSSDLETAQQERRSNSSSATPITVALGFSAMLGSHGQILEFLLHNRNAEALGLFDPRGLIPGYDTIASKGTQTFGMPRRPHIACLHSETLPSSITTTFTFRYGEMSVTEIVSALYHTLRIDPLDADAKKQVDILLAQPTTDSRDQKILDIYRDTTAERAIRTIT